MTNMKRAFNFTAAVLAPLIFVLTGMSFEISAMALPASPQAPRVPRILKFYGVPGNLQPQIKHQFPFVFEREVTLAEIDEIVRFLMKSGNFSNVEVLERDREQGGGREIAVVVSLLRRIQDVSLVGANNISSSEVLRILGLDRGMVFERKHLLAATEDLRKTYEDRGFHNAKIEIDFQVPNDTEVKIEVRIDEGEAVRINAATVESANVALAVILTKKIQGLRSKILTDDRLAGFQKDIADYLSDELFLTAKLGTPVTSYNPDRTLAKIAFTVENPYRFDIKIEGNHHFTDSSITDQIASDKLAGAVSSPAPDLAEKIRRMYQAAGFANVDVQYTESTDEAAYVHHVFFTIQEHPRVKIKKIEVVGSLSQPEGYYTNFIHKQSSDLVESGYYNRKDIEEGARKLVVDMQNNGYLRAKINSQRAEYSDNNSAVTVTLAVDEGPLTQIRQIRFEGVDAFPKAQLIEMLKIKTGSALGLKELEDSITILKNFYHSEGFLEMKILNESEENRVVNYNEGNTQATVNFHIAEGPRVRVGSVTTSGNSFTKDVVILRELPFKQGDVLTPEKIDEATFRLQKLNIFSKVAIRTLEEGTSIAERTVIVEVAERDPGTFVARLGLTNERNYATIRNLDGVSYNNLNGTGRVASLRLEPKYSTDPRVSYPEEVLTLSYTEPYVLGDRNRLKVNLIREELLFDINLANQTVMQETNSVGLVMERDLSRHVRLSLNVYNLANELQWDRFTYATLQTVNIAKLGPLVEFDYRDDAFNPTKGSYWFAQLEYSDPLMGSSQDSTQTVNFYKATAGTTHYFPLFGKKNLIWVTQQRAGYLANVSGDVHGGVPAQEAFFLGGRSTIRGFVDGAFDEKIPNWADLNLSANGLADYRNFRVRANSSFVLFKSDLWFPIWKNIGGTIFYDGGNVWVNQQNVVYYPVIPNSISPNASQPAATTGLPWRDSVGFGLRVITPVGPVNAEIGFKLNRRIVQEATTPGGYDIREAPWALHLSVGAL